MLFGVNFNPITRIFMALFFTYAALLGTSAQRVPVATTGVTSDDTRPGRAVAIREKW
jgi:hypothetical protein